MPDEWEVAGGQQRWMRLNAPLRKDRWTARRRTRRRAVMLYQTMLVAAWPLGLLPDDRGRVWRRSASASSGAWLEKALREAKRHSSWAAPKRGVRGCAAAAVLARVSLDPAAAGGRRDRGVRGAARADRRLNGLSQTVLRLTSPGVPDLYQGTEFWDFSLVDPGQPPARGFRGPYDEALEAGAATGATCWRTWQDGRVKLAVIASRSPWRSRAQVGLFGGWRVRAVEGRGTGGGPYSSASPGRMRRRRRAGGGGHALPGGKPADRLHASMFR